MNIAHDDYCYWKSFANQTVDWYQTDSEKQYQENLIKKPEKLKKWGWINNSFTYKFNSHGFRCEEFTDNDSIMFLGCSVTLGVGLPNDIIYPTLLAKSLNLKCYNLGVGGSSIDTAFRIALIYLEKIRPKIVVGTFLFPERTELLTHHGAIPFNPAMLDLKNLNKVNRQYTLDYYSKWIEVPENAYLNQIKNNLAIANLCEQYNIKYVSQTTQPIIDFLTQARDLIHPGTEFHQKLFLKLLEKI